LRTPTTGTPLGQSEPIDGLEFVRTIAVARLLMPDVNLQAPPNLSAPYYDELLDAHPSPVVALNRAIAIAMADGADAGIAVVEEIASDATLRDYLPLATTLGELSLRAGDRARAAAHFARALELPSTTPEKRFLLRKLRQCDGTR